MTGRDPAGRGGTGTAARGDTELSRTECVRLLATASIGRIGLSVNSLPVVLPVNVVLDHDRLLFRTGGGTKLQAALDRSVVCILVDEIDPQWRSGWSVLVTGTARVVPDEQVPERVRRALVPWSLAAGDHVVEVGLELVTGRRVGPVLWT